MHPEARTFLDYVSRAFPSYFRDVHALDVGGGDINGNNRKYFDPHTCTYDANDVVAAPNVTVVAKTSDLGFPDATFDTIISSECFEHDMYYADSLRAILRMLRPGGLFAFTCASVGRPEHGTRRAQANCSYTLRLEGHEDWKDYYRNLAAQDVDAVLDCHRSFPAHAFFYNSKSHDLYFWGIKRGGKDSTVPPPGCEDYTAPGVSRVTT
jgi:SAM-dependent methyltransferase